MFDAEKVIDQERDSRAMRIMLAAVVAGLVLGGAIFVALMTLGAHARA